MKTIDLQGDLSHIRDTRFYPKVCKIQPSKSQNSLNGTSSTLTIKDGHGWLALGPEGLLACAAVMPLLSPAQAASQVPDPASWPEPRQLPAEPGRHPQQGYPL